MSIISIIAITYITTMLNIGIDISGSRIYHHQRNKHFSIFIWFYQNPYTNTLELNIICRIIKFISKNKLHIFSPVKAIVIEITITSDAIKKYNKKQT